MPIIIDGKQIETPTRKILEALQVQLRAMGSGKLAKVEYKSTEASLTCPHHKNGMESNPSCSMMLVDKPYNGKMYPAGTTSCFTCGYKANIVKFCADCMGISYRKASEWLLGFCDYSLVAETRDIGECIFEKTVGVVNNYDTLPKITIDVLKKFDYFHPYMYERKLTDEVIDKFEVGYEPETDCLTFPVYVNGECLFIAKRKVRVKQFIMPPIEPKPIYGLDYIDADEIIVCESVINALTCWGYGKQAVALFGTGSDYQIKQLQKIGVRKIVLALDGDNAGRKGTAKIKEALSNKIVTVLKVPEGKDINNLSKQEFDELEEEW